MKQIYTQSEIEHEINLLKNTFDIVRLVNPVMGSVIRYDARGNLVSSGCFCFETWNKNQRCKNCISAVAFSNHCKQTKLESIGNKLYNVIARYIVVDGLELVLEAVSSFDADYASKILSGDGHSKELINLYKQVSIDDLTGLYNRRYFRENLPPLILKAESSSAQLGVLFVDIDNFKKINDEAGHVAGDCVLTSIASSLHMIISENPNDFVARFGGDKFVAVIENANAQKLESVSQKILRTVNRTAISDYPFIKASVSIGGAVTGEAENYEQLLSAVDKRLYKAKSMGKGVFCVK